MLTGSLRSNGYCFGKRQIGQTLQSINSVPSTQIKVKAGRLLSPRVYSAEYFGQNIHFD